MRRQSLPSTQEPRNAEENFTVLFDENPIPTLFSEMPSGKIAFVNRRMADLFGKNPGDIVGKTANELGLLQNPADQDRLTAMIGAKGYVDNMEVAKVFPDGSHGTDLISMRLVTMNGKPYCLTVVQDITGRKQAEEALRKSEERYRWLVETTDTGYVIIDVKGVVLDANAEYVRLSGHEKLDEILGRSVVEWTAQEEKETNAQAVAACMKNGFIRNFDITYVDKTGKRTHVEINATVMETEGKQKILTLCRDITERKQVVEALRQSGERYRLLHESAPVGILLINRSGEILEVNSAAIQILGSPSAQATKKINLLTFPLLVTAGISAAFNRCVETGKVISGEYPYVTNWGKSLHMDLRFVPIFDDRNQVTLVHAIAENITDRKQAEEALRLRESYLSAIIENQPGLLWLKDRDGRFLAVNSKFSISCGQDNQELLVGKTDFDIWPRDLAAGYVADDNKVMKSGKPCMVEEHISDKGEIRWFETFKAPIMDKTGEVIGTTGYSRDITERKRMEEELQKSQKLDSLGVLAGGIAHDFNNLLGGIFGHIDLARYVSKEPTVREYLDAVMNTMDRARGLTQQLLTFAKGGAPARKTEPLVPFIQETVLFALSGSTISCTFDLQKTLWASSFDRNQIGQVIDNIIINAQQAMPLGGGIEVSACNVSLGHKQHPVLPQGNYVRISVKDHGVGIPKEILPRIFDPFFTTKTKGHGLGLATCHSIVNRHNGAIDVESEPGKGSTFHLYLPAITESILPVPDEGPFAHSGTGTFIVMDDEKVMRDTIGEMLRSLGYSPDFAKNGKEALDKFVAAPQKDRPIAGVILDLTVPGSMGGKEAASEIRKLNSEIPLFVASGYADDPIMADPRKYGFTASICKPFTIVDLMHMLIKHMKTA
jgi:two-component system, cell cycle sensor histidine kinase and response regulator CckA